MLLWINYVIMDLLCYYGLIMLLWINYVIMD